MKFIFPKEGATLWMDNVAILKGAPNLENAKLFMNFVMDPENAALISAFAKYNNGVSGSGDHRGEGRAQLGVRADLPRECRAAL